MELYDSNGWFNAPDVISDPAVFIFCTGARGTGKTYGVLKYLISSAQTFIYLRRTQEESDLQGKSETSSLQKVIDDLHLDSSYLKIAKKIGHVEISSGAHVYCCALSTFASVRGVDFSDVKYIVYDEMIPEAHAHRIKHEGMALMNLYETVNRNRELTGENPVKFVGLSNSLNIANDIFMEFRLISSAEDMLQKSEEIRRLGNKLLIIMQHSPISDRKKETALYQAASNDFVQMAIHNKFILNDFSYVKRRNLREYKPYMQIGDLYVYDHKSSDDFYVSFSRCHTDQIYTSSLNDLRRLRREQWDLYCDYLDGFVRFENYNAVALFEKYFALV